MAATVVWSVEAEMERQSLQSVNQWSNRLLEEIELLKQFPEMGRMVPEKDIHFIREIFIGDYRLIYSYQNGAINLLTIVHMASQLGKI